MATTSTPLHRAGGERGQGWRDRLVADAAADGVGARWAAALVLAPLVVAAAVGALFVVARPTFYTVQQEDHPVEWAQFALCAFALVVSVLAAVRFRRSGRPGLAVLMVLVALGMLVLAGEEISWGQRVLGLATPAELSSLNHQSETNIHNIDVGVDLEDLFKVFELVLGLVAASLSLVLRSRPGRATTGFWYAVAPPLVALPGFVAIAAYRAAMLVLDIAPVVAFQETVELALYLSLALTALAYWVRAGGSRAPLPLVAAALVVVAVTVVLALMSAHSGVLPGNLPGAHAGHGG